MTFSKSDRLATQIDASSVVYWSISRISRFWVRLRWFEFLSEFLKTKIWSIWYRLSSIGISNVFFSHVIGCIVKEFDFEENCNGFIHFKLVLTWWRHLRSSVNQPIRLKTSTHQFEKVPKTENNENMIQKLRKQQCIVDCSILSPS